MIEPTLPYEINGVAERNCAILWRVPEGVILGDSKGRLRVCPAEIADNSRIALDRIVTLNNPYSPYVVASTMDRVELMGTNVIVDIVPRVAVFDSQHKAYSVRCGYDESFHTWYIKGEPQALAAVET